MRWIWSLILALAVFTWASEKAEARTQNRSIQKKVVQLLNSKGRQMSSSPNRIWNYAHWSAENNQFSWSNRLFVVLLNRQDSRYDRYEIYMNIGRNYYQMKMFKSALHYFKKVPKSSDLWYLSVEERAWAKVRMGQFDRALADAATLLSPVFRHISTPETHYLYGYINLAICNYKNVFKNTSLFKKRHTTRIAALESLQKRNGDAWVSPFLSAVAQNGLEESLTKTVIGKMPRYFYRYQTLKKTLARIEARKKFSISDYRKVESQLARMATWDLQDYRVVIKKLQLIEADVIQRIHVDETLLGKRNWISPERETDPYALKFPFDEEDVWVDELDNYDVQAKSCPKLMEASL